MEILTALITMMIIIASIIGAIRLLSPLSQANINKRGKASEIAVSRQLRRLDLKSYVLFENIILPSNGNTLHTEIDHVVVSPYGIFCIETKSHKGSIYAYEKNKNWTQYIGPQKHAFNSPSRQNYKHVKALEVLIGSNLKAPIHSYVIFPNAYKLVTDSKVVYKDIDELVRRISKHKQVIYDPDEYTRILKTLAYASSQKDMLSSIHIEEVQAYLGAKVA